MKNKYFKIFSEFFSEFASDTWTLVSMGRTLSIEKQKGRSYKKSETIEYEVELNGQNASHYSLVWTDIWCKGFIELNINNTTQILPFRFQDSSELEVIPMENSRRP
jgi:hypothetical protein